MERDQHDYYSDTRASYVFSWWRFNTGLRGNLFCTRPKRQTFLVGNVACLRSRARAVRARVRGPTGSRLPDYRYRAPIFIITCAHSMVSGKLVGRDDDGVAANYKRRAVSATTPADRPRFRFSRRPPSPSRVRRPHDRGTAANGHRSGAESWKNQCAPLSRPAG